MKKTIAFIFACALLAGQHPAKAMPQENDTPPDAVKVACSPDLLALIREFSDAYQLQHPGTAIDVQSMDALQHKDAAAGANQLDAWLAVPGQIALVTKASMDGMDPQDKRIIIVGREVYVPVMNTANPNLDLIMQQGISPAGFADLYLSGKPVLWGDVTGGKSKQPVHAYRVDDPSFTSYLSDFLRSTRPEIGGNVMPSCEAVVSAVQNDPNAVGFCTLTQLLEMERSGNPLPVAMIPVDMNDNRKLDHFETIYGSVEELSRGIWIGKYTGTLYSRIFALADAANFSGAAMDFVNWIIGGGQEVLADAGYAPLLENEQEAILASLANIPDVADQGTLAPRKASTGFLVTLGVLGLVVVTIVVMMIFNTRSPLPEDLEVSGGKAFMPASGEIPGGYAFDRSHTWTFLERDGRIRIGLDNFLQKVTGPITRVEMKSPGEQVRKGETLFSMIRNGKRLEIKSPVTGTIVQHNKKLAADAALINSDPFAEGWVCLVEPLSFASESETFIRGEKYREWIRNEFVRLKDFFAAAVNPATGNHVVLQDGGEVTEGILADLEPEVWEEFQGRFLRN